MRYIIYITFFALPLLLACEKQPDPCPDNDCNGTPDNPLLSRVVWAIPTVQDTQQVFVSYVVATENVVYYVKDKDGYEATVAAIEVSTGRTLWEWGDPDIATGLSITSLNLLDDKLIVEARSDLFVINTATGQTIWKNIVYGTGICGNPRSSIINDQIYYTLSECSPNPQYNYLMRTPVTHFEPDTLFKIYQSHLPGPDSGWISGIKPPYLWMHPNGDSIIVFQERAFILGTLKDKVDLYAFNLNTRSLLWKIDSVAIEANSSVFPPVISDGKMYFAGSKSLNQIDLLTGTVTWRNFFTGNTQNTFSVSPVDVGDKILIHPGNTTLYAFDKLTGSKIWETQKVGEVGPFGGMSLSGDYVSYVADPNLYKINHKTGEIIYGYPSPNYYRGYKVPFHQFARTVKVPGTNYIFTSDERFAMLLKEE